MNGTCKCGGIIREANHTVTTRAGIFGYGDIVAKLPCNIEKSECAACGRCRLRIIDADGIVVVDRG